jgi:hypothetical protein
MRPYASSVWGLKLLVHALQRQIPAAVRVKLVVYEALR